MDDIGGLSEFKPSKRSFKALLCSRIKDSASSSFDSSLTSFSFTSTISSSFLPPIVVEPNDIKVDDLDNVATCAPFVVAAFERGPLPFVAMVLFLEDPSKLSSKYPFFRLSKTDFTLTFFPTLFADDFSSLVAAAAAS